MLKRNYSCFFFFLVILLLTACGNRTVTMNYERVFEAPLGQASNQVGSNVPILDSYTNRRGLPSSALLDVSPPVIEGGKVYFADTYNKQVSVFSLSDNKHLFTIPNSNTQYEFARPYLVYVDKMQNIYVVASQKDSESFEVQHYSNQNMPAREYQEFQRSLAQIPKNNYYIYKFSPKAKFLARFGYTSLDPMPMPYKIEGDSQGNIYVYFSGEIVGDEIPYVLMRRYSRTGELNFGFSSQTIRIETNVSNVHYKGQVISVNNLINDEQLLVMVEFNPTTNANGEDVPIDIDNTFSELYIYSVLENNFTRKLASFKGITPGVMGTDNKGRIFYHNYDELSDTLRLLTASVREPLVETNYIPLNSDYYVLNPYFINSQGALYNTLIDRRSRYYILSWKKR